MLTLSSCKLVLCLSHTLAIQQIGSSNILQSSNQQETLSVLPNARGLNVLNGYHLFQQFGLFDLSSSVRPSVLYPSGSVAVLSLSGPYRSGPVVCPLSGLYPSAQGRGPGATET